MPHSLFLLLLYGEMLTPETDVMGQFLGPETDIMGKRYFMASTLLFTVFLSVLRKVNKTTHKVSLAHNVSFWAQKLTHKVSFWSQKLC